jgi:cobalt/nickel transport system ATP-binding protein
MDLDPRGRRQLIHLLRELRVTRLIASHDLEMILELCPRVLVLDQGKLVADGTARTVLANELLMERHGLEVPYSLRR